MEALAIAVAMREARHLGKSAALVTPDRALARRVTAALDRWNLTFDDSGGDGLMETPAGIFARLTAEAATRDWSHRRCWRCSSIRCSGLAPPKTR